MSCTMPQNLFSHQLAGGLHVPLGKGVTISIQNTHRRGDAEIRNKQNSYSFHCIWDKKIGFKKGLFEDQVTVILENVIFSLQLPALSASWGRHDIHVSSWHLLQYRVKYVCLSEADNISTFLDSWEFLNHAWPTSSRNIIWKPMDLHISFERWTCWYKAQTLEIHFISIPYHIK